MKVNSIKKSFNSSIYINEGIRKAVSKRWYRLKTKAGLIFGPQVNTSMLWGRKLIQRMRLSPNVIFRRLKEKTTYISVYKVIYARNPYRNNHVLKGRDRKRLTDNKEDPVFTVDFNGQNYVVKQIGDYNEDEWHLAIKMVTQNLVCPQMIDYYACIQSVWNKENYILMKKADMDLQDFMRTFQLNITRYFLKDILVFIFRFQLWCIRHLEMVYTDLKCRNMLVIMKNRNNPDDGFQIRMTDIGLMDDIHDDYECDEDVLHDDDLVNFMYPRRKCSQQQCALFTIAMFVIELCVMHIEAYSETRSKGSCDHPHSTDDAAVYSEDNNQVSVGFINHLDGRSSDDKLILLLGKVPFFRDRSNDDIRIFLNNLIEFKYDTVEEAFKDWDIIVN